MRSSTLNTQFYLMRSCQFELHRNSGVSEAISLVHGHTTSKLFAWQLMDQLKIMLFTGTLASIQFSVMVRSACKRIESVEIPVVCATLLYELTLIIFDRGSTNVIVDGGRGK